MADPPDGPSAQGADGAHPDPALDPFLGPAPAAQPPGAPAPRRVDRWAHRRGEPRVFVLLWSMYLMACAALTVFSVRVLGAPQQAAFRPAAQSLMALAAAGLAVLWPMARLSQAAPADPRRAAWIDVLAIALPLQAIIWPTRLLTGWAWTVLGGVSAMLLAWTTLVAALIATAQLRSSGPLGRAAWMAACLVLVAGAPAAMMVAGLLGLRPPEDAWLASPITGVHALTHAASGLSARMTPADWLAATTPAVAGGVWWAALGVSGRGRDPGPPRLQ